jgi:hypothetical protein
MRAKAAMASIDVRENPSRRKRCAAASRMREHASEVELSRFCGAADGAIASSLVPAAKGSLAITSMRFFPCLSPVQAQVERIDPIPAMAFPRGWQCITSP